MSQQLEFERQCLQALIEADLPDWLGMAALAQERMKQAQTQALIPKWQRVLSRLPELSGEVKLDQSAVGIEVELSSGQRALLESQLKLLMPWRKGPFFVGRAAAIEVDEQRIALADTKSSEQTLLIDTEWRSDLKWNRLQDHLPCLEGRRVLDVGGGSGYHAFRAAGLGASQVFNLEPSALFYYQFLAIRQLLSASCTALPHALPVPLSDAPMDSSGFDVVFCMGVLYHRADPFGFLSHLRGCMRQGATLVLETLVIEGGQCSVLVPSERYAQMNNVYFLPSTAALMGWLLKCGFLNARAVSEQNTSRCEQRQTDWMQFHSLADYLDPNDPSKTREGHPAPRRVVILAER